MHNLEQLMLNRISTGLRRRTVDSCSKWAYEYRIMSNPFPGPWRWIHHPWLREMHDSTAEINVGQKAAQMGFTEWALNMTFYKIDVESVDCLYILPTDGDASDFSAGRFDTALEASPHLQALFSDVQNVGHKRAGQCNLYVRGSKSRSKLKSIPTGFIAFDEVDEMEQDNIPLAMERTSGQPVFQVLLLSTPTIEKVGINKWFMDSTQEHFFFKCPHCGRRIEFLFPESIVITADSLTDPRIKDSYYICSLCKGILRHEDKINFLASGSFVPQYADRESRGFTINQLYSSAKAGRAESIALAYLKSLRDKTDEQELYNSKLALPHLVEGSQINEFDIIECIKNYRMGDRPPTRIMTMGVDVGKFIHYEIDSWILPQVRTPSLDVNDECRCHLVATGTVKQFEELDELMIKYGITGCVVDRHPETRSAYQFATRFWGRVLLCMYGRGLMGKQVQLGTEEERTITVDRTSWLDLSLGRLRNRTIDFPIDLPIDYRDQIKVPVRQYQRDKDGNPVGRYISSDADHYAHARNYSEIALSLALSTCDGQDITKVN